VKNGQISHRMMKKVVVVYQLWNSMSIQHRIEAVNIIKQIQLLSRQRVIHIIVCFEVP